MSLHTHQRLIQSLKVLVSPVRAGARVLPAKVLAVSQTTCKVQLLTCGAHMEDVALTTLPQQSPLQGQVRYPQVGTVVWIAQYSEDTQPLLLATEALARYHVEADQSILDIQTNIELKAHDKLSIQNQTDSLRAIWLDLIELLAQLQVVLPDGVSSPPAPATQTKLTALKARIKGLFKA